MLWQSQKKSWLEKDNKTSVLKKQHTVPSVSIKYPVPASKDRIKVSIIFTEHLNLFSLENQYYKPQNMSCNRTASLNKV